MLRKPSAIPGDDKSTASSATFVRKQAASAHARQLPAGPDRRMPDRRPRTAPPPTDSLEGAVGDYLAHKRARGCSPQTVEGYAYALRAVLLPFMERSGLQSWPQLSERELDRLRAHLFEHGNTRSLAPATANTYCRHINYFLRWLNQEGEIERPVRAHLMPEVSRAATVLEEEQLERLEQAALNERDRLIVRILADTGIRVSELTTLRYDRLQRGYDSQSMRVLSKGGEGIGERTVPLVMPGLLRRLERYLQATGGRSPEQPYVFIAKRRDPRSGELEPLTPSGVQRLLRNLGREIGLPMTVGPHLLRHTFITRALRKGVPEVVIARIVGHSDLRMIHRHYQHTTADDAYRMLAQALAKDRRR